MPTTAPPTITALPSPPDPNNRATFNTLAYPWSVAQQTLATEVGAVAANVYSNAQEAQTQAELATTNGAAQVALAATQASNAATSAADANTAKLAAQAAQAAAEGVISALPDGTVNDATTALTDTWSSSKISAELATLDGEKQDALVSGTNIKTFGGQSLLGSGDIVPPESWQVGDVIQTARALSAPDWLPCDGGVYLQSSYADLYAELGLIGNAASDWKFPSNLGAINTGSSYVAAGNGVIVAIQRNYRTIHVSSDGFNWTSANANSWMPANGVAMCVTFGNGLFVVGFGSSTSTSICATSPDGLNWTLRTISVPASTNVYSVDFCNNLFVLTTDNAAGNYPRPQIFTSPDGITWTNRSASLSGFTSGYFNKTVYGNGKYVALHVSSDSLATSVDGVTWTYSTPSIGTAGSIAFGAGKFLIGRSDGDVMTSTDAVTWGNQVKPTGSGSNSIYDVSYTNSKFYVMDYNGKICSSSDGVTWTQHTHSKSPTISIRSSTTLNGRKFAFADSDSNCSPRVISSADDVNWAYSEVTPTIIYASASNGTTTTIAVADSGKVYTYSDYGWVPVNTTIFGTNSLTFAGYENGLFFAGGVNGLLGTSPDGVTWTLRTTGFGGQSVALVSYGNGKWVIAGSAGYIGYSTDAVTWTIIVHPVGVTFTGLIFKDGQFKLYGNNVTLVSMDGVTWTSAANNLESLGMLPYKVTYGFGAYFAVSSTAVLRSDDGLFWRKVHTAPSDNYIGLVIANNVVVAVGDTSSSSSHFVSYDGFNFYGTKSKFYTTNSFKTVFKHGNKLVAAGASTNVSDLFNYDTATQFVTPRAVSVPGQSTYIKA